MFKLIITMSAPAVFSMLIQSLYNVVDSWFVSMLGDVAFTAVTLALPLQNIIIAFAAGTAVGVNSLIARKLGNKETAYASSVATHGLILSILTWVLFAILGIFFTESFYRIFTDDPEVIAYGCQYLSVIMILSLSLSVQITVEKMLQATGDMIHPMQFQLIGAISNIILDPIFIFVFDMKVSGAAYATIAGQTLAMIYSLYILFKKKHVIDINFKKFKVDFSILKEIYKVGVPSIATIMVASVMLIFVNGILMKFSQAVFVMGVYSKVQSFVFMPIFGLTHGLMPIMGYNYGAKNIKRLKDCVKIGLIISISIMLLGESVFIFFPEALLNMFSATPEAIVIGIPALRIISLCFTPVAVSIIAGTLFQACGYGFRSLFVTMLRQLILTIPIAILLSNFGLEAVWYTFVISEGLTLILTVFYMADIYKKINKIAPSNS